MDPIGIVLISVIGALIVVCLVFLGIFMHKRKFKINSLNLRKTYDDYHTQLTTDCANMVSRLKVLGRSNEYFYTMYCERQKQYDDIISRYDAMKTEYEQLCEKIENRQDRNEQLGRFIQELKGRKNLLTEFDHSLWCALVDKMIVKDKENVTVVFQDGTEIKA